MASSKEYLEFILGQLSELEEITYRAMMGEFIIYYRGKIVGGIYDDRLLVKPVKSAISYMPTAPYELPYEGAKEMLLVDEVDNKEFLMNCQPQNRKRRNKQLPAYQIINQRRKPYAQTHFSNLYKPKKGRQLRDSCK